MKDGGFLPLEDDLAAAEISKWGDDVVVPEPPPAVVTISDDEPDDPKMVLGRKCPSVPDGVHERMCALAMDGAIPKTTLEQRQRSGKMVSGTEYGVPPYLSEALRRSYISPNLPPPEGWNWKCRALNWFVAPKGG